MMFSVRPGASDDIVELEAIETTFTTDQVWQVEYRREGEELAVRFRPTRLPRPVVAPIGGPPPAEWPQANLFLVALDPLTGQRVGALVATIDSHRGVAQLALILVAPSHRRQGAGRALLRAASQWGRGAGVAAIVAEARTQNYPASRFLMRCGFVVCGYNDRVFPGRDIALLMCADISAGGVH